MVTLYVACAMRVPAWSTDDIYPYIHTERTKCAVPSALFKSQVPGHMVRKKDREKMKLEIRKEVVQAQRCVIPVNREKKVHE